ncbi:MAG: 4-hydroxythreonine-4-phosphate dehydrogenase PdxA [Planctomycetota bacterium]
MRPDDARPLLALTMGDPAGVGPELVLAAVASEEMRREARLLVVGDAEFLAARAARIGAPPPDLPEVSAPEGVRAGALDAAALGPSARGPDESVIGVVDAAAGRASVAWVRTAARLALDGKVDGIVTAPVNKLSISRAGFSYEGHTELLGEIAHAEPVMMLAGGGLRVALATRHCAVAEVPRLLTKEEIVRTGRVLDAALRRDFGIGEPRIAVLALNPHASDGGRFGDEEARIVAPAVEELKGGGVLADGPLVPDVAFWRVLRGSHDAVVAMYHDQGLIPLKTLAFDRGVNVTLGLPLVRTSPDHGTAFEIAGRGEANPESFFEAIRLAAAIARRRREAGP